MSSIAAIIVRVFLIIFGVVVLGLSVTLAKQQNVGQPPSETAFGSFVGAFSIIASVIGLVSLWIDKLSGLGIMVVDLVTAIFNLAGAIALTVALKGLGSCASTANEDINARRHNKILNGGCQTVDGTVVCDLWFAKDSIAVSTARCQRAQADYIFEYLGFAFGIFILVADWMLHKRRGGGGGASYV